MSESTTPDPFRDAILEEPPLTSTAIEDPHLGLALHHFKQAGSRAKRKVSFAAHSLSFWRSQTDTAR